MNEHHRAFISSYIPVIEPWIEIMDTKFFRYEVFKYTNSNTIDMWINILDAIDHTFELKQFSSKVLPHIPDLKRILSEIYKNRLATEDVERIFKGDNVKVKVKEDVIIEDELLVKLRNLNTAIESVKNPLKGISKDGKESIIKSSFGLKNISVLYFIENYTPVKF